MGLWRSDDVRSRDSKLNAVGQGFEKLSESTLVVTEKKARTEDQ